MIKTKTSNNLLTLAIAYLLVAAVISFGCNEQHKQKDDPSPVNNLDVQWFDKYGESHEQEFTVIQIDSCEYLLSQHTGSRMFSHKGNCKFCAARSKK